MNSNRKKILFVIPSLAGGGAERVFTTLLAHLDRTRFECHLGLLQDKGSYMRDVPADVRVHHLNISRVRYALPGIIRLTRKLRPHVVLSTLGHLNLALILARPFLPRGTKLLIRESAIATSFLEDWMRHPQLWKWLYRRLYKRADKVVCLSDSMVNDLVEHFDVPRAKLVRIYNPVDVKKVQEAADAAPNPYAGPGPHLVAVGRLTRQKGFDVLLSALPRVLERVPNATLTILGQGPLETHLAEQAENLRLINKVAFLGFQENPWRYLKHADLFVLPSRYEGTPNILLEALVLGVPVVATDCPGGTREIQSRNPQIVLVPPENAGALAEAIITACTSPKRPEDTRHLEQRLCAFDLHRIVSEYSQLLEQS